MKALWLLGGVGADAAAAGASPEHGLLACSLASIRLRAAVAALEWKRRGNENRFRHVDMLPAPDAFDTEGARICFATKFTFDMSLEAWLAACRAAKRSQCRVVVDISDYPFRKPPVVQDFYREVLTTCDAVVANSERMADLVAPHAASRPAVVEDAVLDAMEDPRFAPGAQLELLWFGHPTNLTYLGPCVSALAAFALQRRCRLTVLTEGHPQVRQWVQALNARFAPALEARFVNWSLDATRAALRDCDIVLLPSDPADPFKAGASANRMAEAVNAGRFAVASPLQSYLQFADAAWLGQDPVAGIRWALANADEALARIRRGQAIVRERFTPDRIGRQWVELFESLTG